MQTTIEPRWAGSYRSTQIRSEKGFFWKITDFDIKSRIDRNAFCKEGKTKIFLTERSENSKFTFDALHPFSALNIQESRKEREEEELSYKEAFDYFDWNRSGTIPTGVYLLFTMEMTMTIAMLIPCGLHAWYYLVQERKALQFRVWRSICGLPPRARRQMSIEKKRDTIVIWKIYSLHY